MAKAVRLVQLLPELYRSPADNSGTGICGIPAKECLLAELMAESWLNSNVGNGEEVLSLGDCYLVCEYKVGKKKEKK